MLDFFVSDCFSLVFYFGRKFSSTHSAILIPGTLTLNVPRQKAMVSVPGIIIPPVMGTLQMSHVPE